MVPYPEEIDVFTAPHTRMKELVNLYLKKLSTTDFTDLTAVLAFLPDLQKIFNEFKSHENIENAVIMRKLKSRLEALSINDSTVCNCHSDNSLANMLALVQEGYYATDYFSYGSQLQNALQDFTDRFLPHMKEEEEVFQPMLIKYFEYEELKCLKTSVLEYHKQWEKYFSDSLDDVTSANESSSQREDPFFHLPLEMELAVFSYVPQLELLNCRQVCRRWRDVAAHPSLWQEINLSQWIWSKVDSVQLYQSKDHNNPQQDESKFVPDSCICQQSLEMRDEENERENNYISGFITHLLPVIGDHVHKIILSGLEGLTSLQLRAIILSCKAVQYLDMSYTYVSESAFIRLSNNSLLNLTHLDLSGCCNITDSALINLSHAWQSSLAHTAEQTSNRGLKYLSLSGCHHVTDSGLMCLMKSGILLPLIHLDLSGCYLLTGLRLQRIVSSCPNLHPENLSYCYNIYEGPYECEASGCNNVDTPQRFCCATKNY